MSSNTFANARGVMFDVDGCLVLSDTPGGHGGSALPGAADTVAWLKEHGYRVVAFTNASSLPPATLAASLRELGIAIEDHEMLTPAVVAADVLSKRYPNQPVLAFGNEGVVGVLEANGIPLLDLEHATDAAAVMVGWDTEFTYPKVQAACEALWAGADLYTTSLARTFAGRARPTAGLSGFIAKGLEQVTGVAPVVTGKPSDSAMGVICERLGLLASEIIVIGDDLMLEAQMARSNGAIGVITTTGLTNREAAMNAATHQQPSHIVESLDEFRALLAGVAQ